MNASLYVGVICISVPISACIHISIYMYASISVAKYLHASVLTHTNGNLIHKNALITNYPNNFIQVFGMKK